MACAGAEQRRLVERLADQLQAERRALRRQAGRHRDAGQAGHVHRHREDVVQVHRTGSPDSSPMPKAGPGVVGVSSTSTFSKASSKSRAISVRTFCAFR